ncbi:MAG: thioredoxin domain-containing protein [Desulfomonile tiedjei]|nr:thioredoxin domain-containing protein [Desulfomonile tiedjei]
MANTDEQATGGTRERPLAEVQGKANRLIREKSPYLLQHAYNPVDWYAWGDEAFQKATAEDKPIFLSIGYATCHWCHVMEHESFEDDEVARAMNDAFVSIKVDREERPDIDHTYMTVAQMMTGSGGWPLNVIMTPDKRPFFAGTYFPKESRLGRLGMLDLAGRIKQIWTGRREEVLRSADQVMQAFSQAHDDSPGDAPGLGMLQKAASELAQRYDPKYGGFGKAPKFPTPHNMMFLLRYWRRTGETHALEMVEHTLQAMRRGGIYDHVGFGFHRYATDDTWLVPHFEKMLYDQALLAMTYTEAFQATGKPEFRQTAEEILRYVLRDMTSSEGGFYSAEDADSEGEEGKFSVWTVEEIRGVLDPDEVELAIQVYNLLPGGNFREEASGRLTGHNILHVRQTLPQLAARVEVDPQELEKRLEQIRVKLFQAREGRIHPLKDDKILTDWNGLMIGALAKAAQAFDRPEYAVAARKAADFILDTLRGADGRLLHRYREGNAGLPAHSDDYAFFTWGLLELYEATFDIRYLTEAVDLNAHLLEHFWDPNAGGLYFTSDDEHELPIRKKEIYDGATPSGNSVAALNLLRLGRMTANPELERKAETIGRAFSGSVNQFPSAYTQLLIALEFGLGSTYEVVIAGRESSIDTERMVRELRTPFVPNKVVVFRSTEEPAPTITGIAPYTRDQLSLDGKATAYVCVEYQCGVPTSDPDKMLASLGAKKP